MKVKRIDLDGEEQPESVTVEPTHDEAVFLAVLLGRMNGTQEEEVMPGGSTLGSQVYWALAGGVFNRFYENGVEEAAAAMRKRT